MTTHRQIMEPALPDPASAHVPALDGVRALAILLVLMVHAFNRGPDLDLKPTGADNLLAEMFRFGWTGVELFFVLSGFLVTSILLALKSRRGSLVDFYLRRAARIWPPYFVVFTGVGLLGLVHIAALVDPVTQQSLHLWPYYALTLNNYFESLGVDAQQAGKALGPLWSVASEQQYYLLWPAVIFLFSPRTLKIVLPALLAANVALRIAAMHGGMSAGAIYTASLTHLDGIIVGSMIALWRDDVACLSTTSLRVLLAVSGSLLLGVFAWAGTCEALAPIVQIYGYTLVALFYAVVIVMALRDGILGRWLSRPWLRRIGKYSYVMYLIHWPLLLVLDHVVPGSGLLAWIVFYVALVAGLTQIGAASWRWFEQPIISWGRRMEQRRHAGRAAIMERSA